LLICKGDFDFDLDFDFDFDIDLDLLLEYYFDRLFCSFPVLINDLGESILSFFLLVFDFYLDLENDYRLFYMLL
jgi:hypothetical protein